MTNNEKQARLDGSIARLRGQDFKTNPHPLNTNLSVQWSRGYREIEEGSRGKAK